MPLINRITRVAIVGAAGNIGSHMTKALLATNKHIVTAITRKDSTSIFPAGVKPVAIDYTDPESIVTALRGQDALILTLSFFGPREISDIMIRAAAEAEVPWILPNEWSPDSAHVDLVKDLSSLQSMPKARETIRSIGKSSYIAVHAGLWYEWCLATPALFGIDIGLRSATLFDDGRTKINTSTMAQIGRAVAALLSLPIVSENGDEERCLSRFKNGHVYLSSFCVSQMDMIQSACRVTKTDISDWTLRKEAVEEYYQAGIEARKTGVYEGVGRQVYSRVFFSDEAGNFEKRLGVVNDLLELPKEELNDATRLAMRRQQEAQSNFGKPI